MAGWIPSWVGGHAWIVSQVLSWGGHEREPYRDVSLPLFLPPFPSLKITSFKKGNKMTTQQRTRVKIWFFNGLIHTISERNIYIKDKAQMIFKNESTMVFLFSLQS